MGQVGLGLSYARRTVTEGKNKVRYGQTLANRTKPGPSFQL